MPGLMKKEGFKFQFHCGSIKTYTPYGVNEGKRYFNSTVVRLKLSTEPTDKKNAELFQFHCGSIKTKYFSSSYGTI